MRQGGTGETDEVNEILDAAPGLLIVNLRELEPGD